MAERILSQSAVSETSTSKRVKSFAGLHVLRECMAAGVGIFILFLFVRIDLVPLNEALAMDQGGAEIGIVFSAQEFRTSQQEFSQSELLGILNIHQNLTNYGVLEAHFADSELNQPGEPGMFSGGDQAYSLSLRDYHLGRAVLQVIAGDQSFQISNLPVTFSNLFYPSYNFRGLSLGVSHPYLQMKVLGGEMTISKGLLGEAFQGTGEDVYGVAARTQPWEMLTLEGDLFLTENERDYAGNLITRSNKVFRLAGEVKAWSELFMLGEFMESFSENPDGEKNQDLGYRAGALWRGEKLHLEGNYRYMGPEFQLLNQTFQADHNVKGFFAAGDYSPWPFFGISGSFDTSENNLLVKPTSSINESESRSLGLRFYRPPWPTLYWRYYSGNIASRGDFPIAVQGGTEGHFLEISKQFSVLEAYARYEYFEYKDEISQTGSYRKNSPLIGVRASRNKISGYAEVEYDQYSPAAQGSGTDGLNMRVGGSYSFSPNLYLFGEVSYQPNNERYGGQFGINWQITNGYSVRAYGSAATGKTGIGDFINDYANNQVTLRVTKAISWGEKTDPVGVKSGQEWLGTGSIEGWVFEDKNSNGSLDRDEKGVEGIKVKLENGSTAVTDKNGHYSFPAVGAGKHVLLLDAARVPAAYTFVGSETVGVDVQRRGSARVDFPFVLGAGIRGRIVAANGSEKSSGNEAGVADVLVVLKPGDLNAYTDRNGCFSFEGMVPKEYEISLAPETLPERAEILPPRTQTIKLAPGDSVSGLQFLLNIRERRVLFSN